MIGADATTWLALWERVAPESARRRRREFLACSGPPGALPAERLEVGRANAQLLRLHRSMFGRRLACWTECPGCGTTVEIDVDADELLAQDPAEPAAAMQLQIEEWDVSFRLPTEEDIDAVHGERDLSAAGNALLRRCIEGCRRGANETHASLVPLELGARMSARMEERDPLAILGFELRCADCGHAWSSTLEVDVVLWSRLNAWVHRLLRDVHTLAKTYGWSEHAIVEMSPGRRQFYLDLVAE